MTENFKHLVTKKQKQKKKTGLDPRSKLQIPISEKIPISAPILQIGSGHP